MTNTPSPDLDRSVAQFFFEVGYGAAYAEAMVRNDMRPPFELTDALIERAWEVAAEAHEDPQEFDHYLALSRSLPTRDAAIEEAAKRVLALADNEGVATGDGKLVWREAIEDLRRTLSTPTSGEASAPPPLSEPRIHAGAGHTPCSAAESGVDAKMREFAPCPTCGQYSHTIREDQLSEAFMHFETMFSHRGDGIPTQFVFDQKTRDAAQVLMAAASLAPAESGAGADDLILRWQSAIGPDTNDSELQLIRETIAALASSPTEQMDAGEWKARALKAESTLYKERFARGIDCQQLDDLAEDFATREQSPTEQMLREALSKCRDKFLHYEQLHRLKCTAEGDEKADRNREMADMCSQALGGNHD